MSRTTRAHLLLLLTAAIWGFAFVAQRFGADAGAFSFNATRFALGALSLLPLIAFLDRRGTRGTWRAAIVPALVCSLFLFGGSALQQLGVAETSAGSAGFVTGLYIVLVPMLGLFFGHRTGARLWIGVVAAVVGLYLLTVTDALTIGRGDALVLLGTLFWAGHILVVELYSKRVDPLRLATLQFGLVAVASAATAFVADPHPFADIPQVWGAVLFGGLASVGVGYTLQVVAQRDAKASLAALIMSLEAPFAAIGGALILGETMSLRGYLGCALMLAGILLAQWGTPPHPVEPSTLLVEEA